MGTKKNGYGEVIPYAVNPEIFVTYELPFNTQIIKPGDKIRFRNMRGIFIFVRLAHNVRLDSTWIDCIDSKTRGTRSFHVGKLKSVVRPKRSYRKKVQPVE